MSTVGELLLLPDGQLKLHLFHDLIECVECFDPVGCRDGCAECKVADFEVAGTVDNGDGEAARLLGNLVSDASDNRRGVGMSLVVDRVNGPAGIVVADNAAESHDRSRFGALNHFDKVSHLNVIFSDGRIDDVSIVVEPLGRILVFPCCLGVRAQPHLRIMLMVVMGWDIKVGDMAAMVVGDVRDRVVTAIELINNVVKEGADHIDSIGDTAARPRGVDDERIFAIDGDDPGQGAGQRGCGGVLGGLADEGLDAVEAFGDERESPLGSFIAGRDPCAAGRDDDPGTFAHRGFNRTADRFNSIRDDLRVFDGHGPAAEEGCGEGAG